MVRGSKRIKNRSIDRLSDLPDCILDQIFTYLDTRSAVQTCILSRRLRSIWKYVPVLNFNDSKYSLRFNWERHVEQVLSLRSDRICLSRVRVDFWIERWRLDLLDKIMKYSASHGVQELSINVPFAKSAGVFRSVCLYCQSLKVLELEKASIQNFDAELFSRLQLLESLTLTDCNLTFRGDAFTNFPRLETLKLIRCSILKNKSVSGVLIVIGLKLLNLEILSPSFVTLRINAPKLESFSLNCVEVSESDLPSLNRANIALFGPKNMYKLEQYADLFEVLHNVQVLNLEVDNFELLIQTCISVEHQFSPFERLKFLNLKCIEGSVDVPNEVIRYFFRGSPNEADHRFTIEKLCRGR
ncbi:Putative F-box/LRR-repeat protein At5g02930 [Linum grandiflorum]